MGTLWYRSYSSCSGRILESKSLGKRSYEMPRSSRHVDIMETDCKDRGITFLRVAPRSSSKPSDIVTPSVSSFSFVAGWVLCS